MRSVLEAKLARPLETIDKNVMPVAVVLRDTNRLIGDFILRWNDDQHRQGDDDVAPQSAGQPRTPVAGLGARDGYWVHSWVHA